jgi:hypothetical protein
VVAPTLRLGDLARDGQPVVGNERGDHGHAEGGEQGAEQGSGGDPGKGEPKACIQRCDTTSRSTSGAR